MSQLGGEQPDRFILWFAFLEVGFSPAATGQPDTPPKGGESYPVAPLFAADNRMKSYPVELSGYPVAGFWRVKPV